MNDIGYIVVNKQQMEVNNKANSVSSLTDGGIMQLLGSFIKDKRLQQNNTQQQLAVAAGVDRTTLLKMENGSGGNMLSFIQIMRALGELELFKNFETKEELSPLLVAKMMQQKRQRAGYNTKNNLPPLNSKP